MSNEIKNVTSRVHELARAQASERGALAVLHFEQKRVARARKAMQEAESDEAVASARYQAAKLARELLERPDADGCLDEGMSAAAAGKK